MKALLLTSGLFLMAVAPALAAGPFFWDDFQGGMGAWTKWPGATEALQWDTVNRPKSAKAVEADPWSYASYHDFGAEPGFIRAHVYLWDDVDDDGTNRDRPVTNMLQLSGAESPPDFNVDYVQLGVVPWFPAGSTGYGFRTKYNDDNALGFGNANVPRTKGWTKLAIEADPLASGGQIRFYINNLQVGTSKRSGSLQYVRLGNTFKSYDNFWYDDVLVVPEPVSVLLVLLGAPVLLRRRGR